MRIVETYDVTLTGSLDSHNNKIPMRIYDVQKDNGDYIEVSVPNIPHIVDAFKWLSDNDALRYLKNLSPTVTTNSEVIERAHALNIMMHKSSLMSGSTTFKPQQIPAMTYECTWTFYSKEHAILFKMTVG